MENINILKKNLNSLNLEILDIEYLELLFKDIENVDITYLPIVNTKLNYAKNSGLKQNLIKDISNFLSENNPELNKFWNINPIINNESKLSKPYTQDLAPIVIFTYNRLPTLSKLISSLKLNNESEYSELIIFSDGPKNDKRDTKKVNDVRNYLYGLSGFKEISLYESKENKGLANSIVEGLKLVSQKHNSFIVLEDDLLVSQYFLMYMNNSLNTYRESKTVWCINGFSANPEKLNLDKSLENINYWTHRASSHGWGTWSDRWNKINWSDEFLVNLIRSRKNRIRLLKGGSDLISMINLKIKNEIDSWAIKWVSNIIINDGLCLSPFYSHTTHQFIIPGTHIKNKSDKLTNNLLLSNSILKFPKKIKANKEITKSLQRNIYGPKKYERYKYFKKRVDNLFHN